MNRIGIFGVGCIGSIIAKYLHLSDLISIYYFNRSQKSQIKISHKNHRFSLNIQIQKLQEFDDKLDWLIVCLKEYDLQNAFPDIRKLIHSEIKIAVFRNGLDLKNGFSKFIPAKQILETIIDCPAQGNTKSQIIQFNHPKITLPKITLAKQFSSLFTESEIQFNFTEQWKTDQWRKLIESSSIGAIQAVTRRTCSIFKDEKMVEIYRQLVSEAIVIAKIDGAKISNNFEQELIHKLETYPEEKGSSMLLDVINLKPIELNAKIGAIVKRANEFDHQVQVTEIFYHLLCNITYDNTAKNKTQ